MAEPKDATEATLRANAALKASLPADDGSDFELAKRGFIATIEGGKILGEGGRVCWDMSSFAFEDTEDCPPTVNPSLWRQARLNALHGLYEVTPGVYQVRDFDISNITFIEGDEGVIVIDPLTSAECAAAALALYRQHRGPSPVTAVIYTHSHVDHYGGVQGRAQRRRYRRRHADHRAGGLPEGGGQRERARRQRHGPARDLHVRLDLAARPQGPR